MSLVFTYEAFSPIIFRTSLGKLSTGLKEETTQEYRGLRLVDNSLSIGNWYSNTVAPRKHGVYTVIKNGSTTSYQLYFGKPEGYEEETWYSSKLGGRTTQPDFWCNFP